RLPARAGAARDGALRALPQGPGAVRLGSGTDARVPPQAGLADAPGGRGLLQYATLHRVPGRPLAEPLWRAVAGGHAAAARRAHDDARPAGPIGAARRRAEPQDA